MNHVYLFVIAISFILIGESTFCQEKIDSCKITYSQQFDYSLSITQNKKYKSAVETLEEFLYTRDTNLMIANEGIELINFIHEELFQLYLNASDLEFHLLNIGEDSSSVVVTMMLRQDLSDYGEEYGNMLYVHNIYRAHIKETAEGMKVDCSLQLNNLETKKSPFGKYLYRSDRIDEKDIDLKAYENFSNMIVKAFDTEHPKTELTYLVSDRNDAMEIFGFSYSLNVTGIFIRELGILINCTINPLDKHELTHYLLSSFELSKFLSEGIAVHYVGSNGYPFEIFLEEQKQTFKSQNEEEQQKWLDNFSEGKLQGGDYMSFFYAISGKLISEYIEKYSSDKLKEIMFSNPEITPKEFVENYLVEEREGSTEYIAGFLN